jgi:heme exporter protein A
VAATAPACAAQAMCAGSAAGRDVVVDVRDLSRAFGAHRALHRVSLQVQVGERLAIFGPNGSGKTTLLRLLALLLRPTSGRLRLFGYEAWPAAHELRARIGFLGHRPLLDEELTATENLAFYARLYGVPQAGARIAELLDLVGLGPARHRRVRTFSRGMQQRLSLARAVLHNPDLLLLDEPDTGLDPAGLEVLAALLARSSRPRTLIFSSHRPEVALHLAPRAVLLSAGRLVADGPAAEVAARLATHPLGPAARAVGAG